MIKGRFAVVGLTVTVTNNSPLKITSNEGETEEKEISISPNETVTVDDLTITHASGGHKLYEYGSNVSGVDHSYAKIILETTRKEKEEFVFMESNKDQTVKFDGYIIFAKSIGWDGTSLVLSIRKEV